MQNLFGGERLHGRIECVRVFEAQMQIFPGYMCFCRKRLNLGP